MIRTCGAEPRGCRPARVPTDFWLKLLRQTESAASQGERTPLSTLMLPAFRMAALPQPRPTSSIRTATKVNSRVPSMRRPALPCCWHGVCGGWATGRKDGASFAEGNCAGAKRCAFVIGWFFFSSSSSSFFFFSPFSFAKTLSGFVYPVDATTLTGRWLQFRQTQTCQLWAAAAADIHRLFTHRPATCHTARHKKTWHSIQPGPFNTLQKEKWKFVFSQFLSCFVVNVASPPKNIVSYP